MVIPLSIITVTFIISPFLKTILSIKDVLQVYMPMTYANSLTEN